MKNLEYVSRKVMDKYMDISNRRISRLYDRIVVLESQLVKLHDLVGRAPWAFEPANNEQK